MRPLSIRVRLTGWYCAVLLFGLGLFALGMWYVLQVRLMDGVDRQLAQRVAGVRAALGESDIRTPAQLRRELSEFAGEVSDGSLVQLRAPSGVLLESTPHQPVFTAPLADDEFRTVEAGGVSYRLTAAHLDTAGDRYEVLVARSLADVRGVMSVFRYLLLLMIPGVLLLASLGGYWISSRALRPVDQITSAAESIGVRDLSRRIAVPGTGDELARLAQVWNAMLGRLELSVQRIHQFTADASHELRTPLALIRTNAEVTLRRDRPPEEYRRSLEEILHEVARITQLSESLLTLARSDANPAGLTLAPVDLAELARSVIAECACLAEEKGLRMILDTDAAPVPALADAAALHRLLLVLLDNAIRHTPAGGAITVAAHRASTSATLCVRDTGPGIPNEALPHIFERFYRVDTARTGGASFGLGLSIAQAIARAHGSELAAANIAGGGASFRLTLAS